MIMVGSGRLKFDYCQACLDPLLVVQVTEEQNMDWSIAREFTRISVTLSTARDEYSDGENFCRPTVF
jgi:hypothetical protein